MKYIIAIVFGLIVSACGANAPNDASFPKNITFGKLTLDPTGDCDGMSITIGETGYVVAENNVTSEDRTYTAFWMEALPEVDGEIAFGLVSDRNSPNVLTVTSTIDKRHPAWPAEANPVQEIYFYQTDADQLKSDQAWEIVRVEEPIFSSPMFECAN